MNSEEWRPVIGYEGRYEVSNLGRVRSLPWVNNFGHTVLGKVLKFGHHPKGYAMVNLSSSGATRMLLVHRMVLQAFVGECPEGHECAHFDGCKTNNRLSNLRWATPLENSADSKRLGVVSRGESHPSAVLSDADIREIFKLRAEGLSQQAIADAFGVSQPNVSLILNGKSRAQRREYA